MRPKELCFLVAFHTTTEALALEEAARSADVPGRLIPHTHPDHSRMWSGMADAHRRERKNEKPIDKMRPEIRKYI